MKDRFEIRFGVNDPRGSHHIVCDNDNRRLVACSAWDKGDIVKLKNMLDNGEIEPDYRSRPIGADAKMHLIN